MSSTHLSLHYHLIFATKNRVPIIAVPWRSRLHGFLGGTVTTLGGVGGVADHVHLLMGLRATHCLTDVVREIKAVSWVWVHNEIGEKTFARQEGYGAFSVSASMLANVRSYIELSGGTPPATLISGGILGTAQTQRSEIRRTFPVVIVKRAGSFACFAPPRRGGVARVLVPVVGTTG